VAARRPPPEPSPPAWPDLPETLAHREEFGALPLSSDPAVDGAPLLIVHDKSRRDRKGLPVTFIAEATLDRVLGRLKRAFRAVCIRHGEDALPGGDSEGHNSTTPMDHAAVLRGPSPRCWTATCRRPRIWR
jgi:hypothetical protein